MYAVNQDSSVNPAGLHFTVDIDHQRPSSTCRPICSTGETNLVKILQFGRELHAMGEQLKRENGRNEANKKVLKVWVI